MSIQHSQIIIQVNNLSKTLGSVKAVDNLNLQVLKGEIFGFLGPNGAGKTTSINMMCGLLKPDKGETYIDGKPVSHAKKEFMDKIGFCPQESVIWSNLTCLEQLAFLGSMYDMDKRVVKNRSEMLLNKMGLTEKRNKLAHTLSGGMKRRLNLIMALVHDPEIVVLDEPEAGLDPQSRVLVRDYIRELSESEGKTIILTTHNMDEADRLAHKIAIIDYGKLLVVDTPENLKSREGKGDILEIGLLENKKSVSILVESIKKLSLKASASGNTLLVSAYNAVEILQKLLETIKNNGFEIKEVKLRTNTLEDVFISMTGRRLRE